MRRHDIAILRPKRLSKKERFETSEDAAAESKRSEKLLVGPKHARRILIDYLRECRDGFYNCDQTFCPICARDFRRWMTGELLRLTDGSRSVRIYTILLQEANRDDIEDLDPRWYDALLRKRLERAGLKSAAAIGGFEIVYKARKKIWVLHLNLVTVGGKPSAHEKFIELCSKVKIDRPIMVANLKDPAQQLSYVSKFGTYHRPFEQQGQKRSQARPLNAREHILLVQWMGRFEFKDFLFLYNARRNGASIKIDGRSATDSEK